MNHNNSTILGTTKIKLTAFLMLAVFFCSAQDDSRIAFAIQINPALSWFNVDDSRIEPNGAKLGLQMGGMIEYEINDKIRLTTGFRFDVGFGGKLVYEEAGSFWLKSDLSDESLRNTGAGSELDYNIQYVEIPFGLIFRTNEFGASGFRAYVEPPTPTILISTKARGRVDGSEDENILDDIRALNFGLSFGAGVTYAVIDGMDVQFGLSYTRSFSDNINKGQWANGEEEDSKAKLGILSFKVMGLF